MLVFLDGDPGAASTLPASVGLGWGSEGESMLGENFHRTLLFTVGLFFLTGLSVFAQKITGDISGTVTDASSAALSGAIVTATNRGNGEKASATTNENGFYRLVNLSPGQYRVSVTATGFKTSERDANPNRSERRAI